MKRTILTVLLLFLCNVLLLAQTIIIPEPVSWKASGRQLKFSGNVHLTCNNPQQVQPALLLLNEHTGIKISTSTNVLRSTQMIELLLDSTAGVPNQPESYQVHIAENLIRITAPAPVGIYYGVQTLLQLLPADLLNNPAPDISGVRIPCGDLLDYPRFKWRGLMLDVSRHFYTKEEVKEFIDQMVRYKYNRLHWHLTDDEGWRVEIKSYPKLTSTGAWRAPRTGYFGSFPPVPQTEAKTYGGFYTQEEIRDIVAYARNRYVEILPEIDIPGHSLAAIASYPELACTPDSGQYQVRAGETIMDWHSNGTFTALVDNSLCPANENTYLFIDKVLGEIASLFPSEYIHVGGDECAKNFWEKSDAVKQLMLSENLKDMHAVQAYFEKRVSKIVTSKGKRMIGWDEILEGGLPDNAAVMSWRGERGGIAAAKMGHEVVMTPTTYCYLDYMQADPAIDPHVYASLTLKKTYDFNPLPEGVDPHLILGGQGNIWTEQMYQKRHLQYMVWPRALSLSECLWSLPQQKNWNRFVSKVEAHHARFDRLGINYSRAMYDPIVTVTRANNGGIMVALATEIEGLSIHYTFDNGFPDTYYPVYTAPLQVPEEASMLRIITSRNGKLIGRMITISTEDLRKRLSQK